MTMLFSAKRIFFIIVYCIVGSLNFSSAGAETSYVTDDFEVMLRTGPGMDNRIIKGISSGTPMSVVVEDAGRAHSQVRLDDGTVGFVLTRFISSEPSSKIRADNLAKKLDELKSNPKGLQSKLLVLQESYDKLSQNYRKVIDDRDNIKQQLEKITLASSDAVSLSLKTDNLENENRQLILQMDDLRIQNETMKDQSDKKWFALGAVTIILGLLLGYILSRFKGRRRASW